MTNPTYRSVNVDGLDVFYREAGNPDAQTLLLLHGFPTSGHMFRDLIPLLEPLSHSWPEAGGGCHGNDDCPSQSEGRLAFLIILDDRVQSPGSGQSGSWGGAEMEMDLDFKPGDVVQLNSGGPKMTVEAVQSDGTLRCVWFHQDGKQDHGVFAQGRASRCQNEELNHAT